MECTIKWLDAAEYIRADLDGAFLLADAKSAISDIVDDPGWSNGDKVLVDETHVDVDAVKASDIEEISKVIGQLDNKVGMSRIAIVGPSDLQFGFARQFQIKAESRTTADVRAFRSEEAASKWLINGLSGLGPASNTSFPLISVL